MTTLPKIPSHVFSSLGPIVVSDMPLKKAEKRGLVGLFDWCARTIRLRPGMAPAAQWMTLWHEATHVALMDGGMSRNVLTKEQEEAVCDAVAHYLAAMTQAGWLKFTVPQAVRDL